VATLEAAAQATLHGDADEPSWVLVTSALVDPACPPEPQRLLCWLQEVLAPLISPQPFTYTPEFAAALAQLDLSRSAPHADIIGRLTVPPDFLSIARASLGITAVLGALRATGNWDLIYRELPEDR